MYLILGNKCDITEGREIPYHIGEMFAQKHNMKFIETSAKESANVEQIFQELSTTLLKQANQAFDNNNRKSHDTKVLKNDIQSSKIYNCC